MTEALSDEALLAELGVDVKVEAPRTYTALEARLIAGFEDIQTVVRSDNGVGVNLRSEALFSSGQIRLSNRGRENMVKVAEALTPFSDLNIRIEGHTDNVPVGGTLKETHASNWEVSVARAASTARYLQSRGGLNPATLSAQGFGEHRPLASNDTAEGRNQNRRIEIVITP